MQTRKEIRQEIARLQELLRVMRRKGINPPKKNRTFIAAQIKLSEFAIGKRLSVFDVLKLLGKDNTYVNRSEMYSILRECGWVPYNAWQCNKTVRGWIKKQ